MDSDVDRELAAMAAGRHARYEHAAEGARDLASTIVAFRQKLIEDPTFPAELADNMAWEWFLSLVHLTEDAVDGDDDRDDDGDEDDD